MRRRFFVRTCIFKTLWLFNIQLQFIAPKSSQCIFYLQLPLSMSFGIKLLCWLSPSRRFREVVQCFLPTCFDLFIYLFLSYGLMQFRLTSNLICMTLELLVFLPLLPKSWDDRHYANMPSSCSAGKEPQALRMLGKHSTN